MNANSCVSLRMTRALLLHMIKDSMAPSGNSRYARFKIPVFLQVRDDIYFLDI